MDPEEAGHVQHVAASAGLALQIFENPYYKEGAGFWVPALPALRVEVLPFRFTWTPHETYMFLGGSL